jgi:hypothetical protein
MGAGLCARAETWEDGLLPRLPAEGAAVETSAATLLRSELRFGELELGLGKQLEEFGLGLTASVGLQSGTAAQGEFFQPGPVGADLWFLVHDGPSTHGFGLGGSSPVRPQSFYWLHPAETGTRVSVSYVGQTLTSTDVQLKTELRMGVSTVMPLELSVGGSVTKVVSPALAVSGALVVGYVPSGSSLVGLQLRPLPARSPVGLELDLLGGLSIPLQERIGPSVQAMAAIKGWWVGTGDGAR